MNIHSLFVILNYISVAAMFGCTFAIASHNESRMQKLALTACLNLTVCCLGFLFRIEATGEEGLITGQKLLYAFVTHGMYQMLLFVLEYCGFGFHKPLRYSFHVINCLMTGVVLTMNHHTLFYRRYWAVDMGGYWVLEKEYGPLHTAVVLLFALYMAAAVAATLYFFLRNRKRRPYVLRLQVALSLPCLAYIVPKLFGWKTDLQPIAFACCMLLVLRLIYRFNLYDVDNIALDYSIRSMTDALIVLNGNGDFRGCNDRAYELFPRLSEVALDARLAAELPELVCFLDGSTREFTVDGKYFDVEVRPIKGGETGQVLWFRDVTLERENTRLLQERVETLFTYSYKDELTGLGNRRAYEDALTELRALPQLPELVFVAVDLNGLKAANDNIGHSAGDTLLRGTADVLREVFYDHAQIFRTGGDEFFVIIREPKYSVARLEDDLLEACGRWEGLPGMNLSLSCGFAETSFAEPHSVDELMSMADRAMYACKHRYYADSAVPSRKN